MNEKTLRVLEYNKIIEKLEAKAQSKLGKEMVRGISPLTNIEEIEIKQNETKEALELLIGRGNPPLYGIFDIGHELRMADIGGVLSPKSLLRITDSLRVSRDLKQYMKAIHQEDRVNFPIINGLIEDLRVLKHIEEGINQAIINENEISDNASPKLRTIRRQIINKNNSIKDRLNSITSSHKYQRYLQDSIVTMRDGRYVVPIKQENKAFFPGIVHDQSASGATLFVEPMVVVELNNELRELELEEDKEIEEILRGLTNLVANESSHLASNQKNLQVLDFIFAKGKLALEMDGTKPVLNKKKYINIKSARHPLLEAKTVVPIDIYLGKDFNALVITGPNTGGKTVTLKTVGLLTLLAQSGLHIPADFNSEVGVFNQIFADIGDEQSIEQSLSTFSSHMTNIVEILEEVDGDSLVLFDELGAGTDPTEGAALAMAILDHLLKRNIPTLATTHYSQLKIYALTTEGVRNASVEFDVETLRPTYKLLIGVPGKSNAFEISKRLGLQNYIIQDAKALMSKENVEFENVLQAIDRDRRIIEEEKLQIEKLKTDIKKLEEELNREKEKTSDSRERIILEAREEARHILRRAREESDMIVKELRGLSHEVGRERNRKIHESQERLKGKLNEVESALSANVLNVKSKKPPKDLKIGDTVEVLSLNQVGNVLELPDDDGNVQVQVGIMKINVHISSLKRAEMEEEEKTQTSTKAIVRSKAASISNEIDLRGKTLDEALLDLDKYIDDIFISGLKEAYIIHGKGTGVLREGIKSYLKSHRHVRKFRPGKYGEGGDGVTIVEIK